MPVGAPTFAEALRMGAECFHALKKVLKGKNYSTGVGDEGGFAPNLRSAEEALDLIAVAVRDAGYTLGKDIFIALDPATSEMYDKKSGKYEYFRSAPGTYATSAEMIDRWGTWFEKYPIRSLEDGLAEDDWAAWKTLTPDVPK